MRIPDDTVEKLLVTSHAITGEQLDSLRTESKIEQKPLQDLVIAHNILSENELTQLYGAEVKTTFAPGKQLDKKEAVSQQSVAKDSPTAQTVNVVIESAIKAGASDIHIEPRESYVSIRYRTDGVLREANKLPKKDLDALVSRIKTLANLKTDEQRAPQDGHFKTAVSGQTYALRVSTLPIIDGEKVVIRILNESTKAATLEELGYWGLALKNINKAIVQTHGMILLSGPASSGKSTSLFSILSLLNSPIVNISTIEDPVEYRIQGANQTQVNQTASMTFASGLSGLLKQDPNIILVGEIRDSETATLAVQAAVTGHLILSTLHTSNAATCLPRLLDMGIEPFLVASTIRVLVGQRLARKLCMSCRESYEPDAAVLRQLDETFRLSNSTTMQHVHDLETQALEAGIGRTDNVAGSPDEGLSTSVSTVTRLWRAHDGGCEHCGHTGYKGRIGIYEVLDNSPSIQKLIITKAAGEVIEDQAIKDGMVTMQLDGFIKALRGQTTVEEAVRVTTEK